MIPVATIKRQALTNTPTNGDATIMDDTVVTMDGTALMGGPVTIQTGKRTSVKPVVARLKMRVRR